MHISFNFETANDIVKFLPFKESLPKHMQSHHLMKCLDCDADYIGKTSRQIERRSEEHKSGSKNEDTYDSSCFEHEKSIIIQLITIILKY